MDAPVVKTLLAACHGKWTLGELQPWAPFLTYLMRVCPLWPPKVLGDGLLMYDAKVGGHISEKQHTDWAREGSFFPEEFAKLHPPKGCEGQDG